MKVTPRILTLSIALNLLLLGGVAYMVIHGSAKPKDAAPAFAPSGKVSHPDSFQAAPGSLFPSQPVAAETGSRPQENTPREVARNPNISPSAAPAPIEDTKGAIPAVFVDPDPAWNLSEDQLDALANLRQSFVDSVGGENQDPSNPEYLRKWKQVQPNIDRQLRALLGADIYNRLQLEAAKQQSNLPDR